MLSDGTGVREQGRLEAQIIPEAAGDERVRVSVREPRPELRQQVPDGRVQIAVELRIVRLHERQVSKPHQILTDFEDSVAHSTDPLHSFGHRLRERVESGLGMLPITCRELAPRIPQEVCSILDWPGPPSADRSALRQYLRHTDLERGDIIGH